MYEQQGPVTSARVDFRTNDNTTFLDALQFVGPVGYCGCTGPTGVTGWQLTGTFQMDIRGAREWGPTGPSISLSSAGQPNSVIVVVDPVALIMNFNVPPNVLIGQASAAGVTGPGLIPGAYKHALRMTQGPNIVELIHGDFYLVHGI